MCFILFEVTWHDYLKKCAIGLKSHFPVHMFLPNSSSKGLGSAKKKGSSRKFWWRYPTTNNLCNSPCYDGTFHSSNLPSHYVGGRCPKLGPDVFNHWLVFQLGKLVKARPTHNTDLDTPDAGRHPSLLQVKSFLKLKELKICTFLVDSANFPLNQLWIFESPHYRFTKPALDEGCVISQPSLFPILTYIQKQNKNTCSF